MSSADTVASLLAQIAGTGRDEKRGGCTRPVFSGAELDLRSWFTEHAQRRSLDVETDRNGIIWAWLDAPHGRRENAVATGSHLDSVLGGGAYDGPLGVASSLIAIDRLRESGAVLERPLAIAVFPEEEGSRFGVACLGSRLATGAIDPARALGLSDPDGTTFADALRAQGWNPSHVGRDDERIGRLGEFIELHVEQGRALAHLEGSVAIASSILGHGRWRVSMHGQGNHAGTTLMPDRRDPMVAAARLVVAVRDRARAEPGARATVGRIHPIPGGTNVVAARVDLWLDIRHPDDAVTARLVADTARSLSAIAAEEGCSAELVEESFSETTALDPTLRDALGAILPGAPELDTGAGHDAGVLAAAIPTAMLFVRNPSGISHSHEEHVEPADAEAGARALADVLLARAGIRGPALRVAGREPN